MKRNVGSTSNDHDDDDDDDDNCYHNSEKRTRPSGGTTTNITTTTSIGTTAMKHQPNRSLSSMDERNRDILLQQHTHPSHRPEDDFPTDDHAQQQQHHHHHFHPYYHHHHHQPQPQPQPQPQEYHPFPAQVLPEEEMFEESDQHHYRSSSHRFVPPASIRDDDHDNNDKSMRSGVNQKSHSFNDSMNSNSKSNKKENDEYVLKSIYSEGTDDSDVKVTTDTGITANDDDNPHASTLDTTTDIDGPDHNNIDRATSQDYYFDSYAHHAIHEEMLKDEVRTKTYEMAICQNKHLFQDKIVLDVGCGTGILSMFAARAGAKHIYAVDCSSIIVQAQKIININGLSDQITLIRGKVEDIDLPVESVDIIISEWMGYFLLYESMLDTVLFARDKWLVKKDGIIFPDKAVMYITAIEDGNVRRDRFDYWDDVYGFDMSPIKEIALREPVVDVVDAKALVTDGVPILSLDILTCTKEDLDFTSSFKLQALRNDYIHGLVAYFECAFTQIHKPIGFSTSPMARYTHWKQTILYLPDPLTVCAGEVLMGDISCRPNQRNRRDLDIGLTLTFKGRYSECDNKKIPYRLR